MSVVSFLNYRAISWIYTLSLHDALPISVIMKPDWRLASSFLLSSERRMWRSARSFISMVRGQVICAGSRCRSEEHTSELQSRENLVCRLLLEKKKYRDKIVSLR